VCPVSVDRSRRFVLLGIGLTILPNPSLAGEGGNVRGTIAGKPETKYPDFQVTASGLQYRDVRMGSGPSPSVGDRVVVDWEGYTLGHQGRPFAAKNKVKGGDFQGDQDYCRWVQGQHTVIPALEEAVSSMKQGGVRQVIFQGSGLLGYPASDPKHEKVGPKPKTFAGTQRLDFVLSSKVSVRFDTALFYHRPRSSPTRKCSDQIDENPFPLAIFVGLRGQHSSHERRAHSNRSSRRTRVQRVSSGGELADVQDLGLRSGNSSKSLVP